MLGAPVVQSLWIGGHYEAARLPRPNRNTHGRCANWLIEPQSLRLSILLGNKMKAENTHPLIEQLQKVDAELEPAGLYAAEKQVLWSKVLYPVLKRGGGKIDYARPGKLVCFTDSDGREGIAELFSFSAVKVRKFGDRFAMDARVDYHDRWDNRRIQKKICGLWTKDDGVRRIFAVVGFDRGDDPFRREFDSLARQIDWAVHGLIYAKKVWQDIRGREFSCVAAVWEK
jgi:hypothetical protein